MDKIRGTCISSRGLKGEHENRDTLITDEFCRVGLDPPIRDAIAGSRDSRLRGNDTMGGDPAEVRTSLGRAEIRRFQLESFMPLNFVFLYP